MKYVIAPNAYKGSLSAFEAAIAIQEGLQTQFPEAEYIQIPLADGGTGTLDILLHYLPGQIYSTLITAPLGNRKDARFGIINDSKTAIIEIAEASGLHLVCESSRNPLKTTSYGTGELILAALNEGCRSFIIGLGGSATCDGGMGALKALGLQFKDAFGQDIEMMGEGMLKLNHIITEHLDPRLADSHFILAHDVDSPLLGLSGALRYTPQKGGNSESIEELHKGLEQYAFVVQNTVQKNISTLSGTGAAGGLAAGLYGFLNAKLTLGSHLIMNSAKFSEKIKEATLIITGEGQLDAQTLHGKTPFAVAQEAKKNHIPVIGIVGRLGLGFESMYECGMDALFTIINHGPKEEFNDKFCTTQAKPAKQNLRDTAQNVARLLALR